MKILNTGFTLVELIVVIAIIGLLATIGVSSYNNILKESKYTKTRTEITEIVKMVKLGRDISGKTLIEITGSGCSECACRNGQLQSASCATTVQTAIGKIATAANNVIDVSEISKDFWGNPYLLNENEGETPGVCNTDNIASAGPDGIYYNADDILYNIATFKCNNTTAVPHHPNMNWK
ncbi:type II secretion system protein [Candidatus Woesebacteria bacterium]|nr:type II secretion system protein [Candidatus Woesebacteria bacterium]